MIQYLKDHAEEVYPLLETKGKKVREGVQRVMNSEGIQTAVTGIGSLFQTHFPLQGEITLDSPDAINRLTDAEKKEVEFRMRMLTKGVHVMHGGGALSTAHSDEDIGRIIEAAREVAKEMAEPGPGKEVV